MRLLVAEAQFFFTHMFAKKLFKIINDKQIIKGVAKDGDTRAGSAWCHPVCVTHLS